MTEGLSELFEVLAPFTNLPLKQHSK